MQEEKSPTEKAIATPDCISIIDEYKRSNQLQWNESVSIHMKSDFYRLREFIDQCCNALHHRRSKHEHKTLYWQAFPWMESCVVDGKEEWRLPESRRDNMPLMYSIRAHKEVKN